MHIILTGATGTCGSAVLQHCLTSPAITRVSILSRRPIPRAEGHAKASVIIHKDFAQYPQSLLDRLKDAEACVWALGVSQADVNKEKYIEITHDYTIAAAKAFSTLSNPFKFVFVSGEGADPTERTFTLFGKIKGRTEKELHALSSSSPTTSSLRTFAVRPGLIDPEGTALRDPPLSTTRTILLSVAAPVLRRVWSSNVIGTAPLAGVLTDLALGDGAALPSETGIEADGRTLRNVAIRRLAGFN